MKIWICIPVFNRKDMTLRCLATLHQQTFINFTVVICDHGSSDGTSEAIFQQYPNVVVIKADSTLWWTGAINRSIAYALEHAASDDVVLTLNNDNEVPPDYLENFRVNHTKYSTSILSSVIYNIKTGELNDPGFRQNWLCATAYPVDFVTDHLVDDSNLVEITHASGRGTLFPIKVFRQLGLFEEKNLPHYGADYSFAFKAARANYRIYSCLNCKVYSYIEETGLVKVLNKFSLSNFVDYFTSTRSPGNLKTRWWFGWLNCPKHFLMFHD
jgi:GT2 family glycosyltransferase